MPKKTQKTYNQKPTRLAYYAYCVEFLSKIKKNKQEVFCTVALCCTIIKLMSIEDCRLLESMQLLQFPVNR